MYRIHQIKLDIDQPREMIPAKIAKALGIKNLRISQWHIVRESLDARDKKHIRWIYTVAAAREYAKEHGFQVVGAEEKIA